MAEVWNPPVFDDIATSDLVTAAYLNQLGNSLRYLKQVDIDEVTSDHSVTSTTAAGATTVATVGGFTLEAVPHIITFKAARVHNTAGAAVVTHINLWQNSTDLGIWGSVRSSATGDSTGVPIFLEHYITPTAASHTFTARAWRVTSNNTINGAAGTYLPIVMRLLRVPT